MTFPNKPKTVSLFTGGGGLDIGFHRIGFDILACVEINEKFCESLRLNRPRYFSTNCRIICRDIRELDVSEIGVNECDFIIGGPPCQSFSAAGRRAGGIMGVNDDRGSLFEHYCRFIRHLKPKGFLFENVRGILSANKRNDWQSILSAFSNLGYEVFYRILDAADYGVPQHRERLIMVGVQKGSKFLFPRPLYGPDSADKLPYISCYQAIADLQDPTEQEHEYPGKYGNLLKLVPPGMNYHFFTRELGYPNPIFAWRSRFSDFLYKAHPDQPVRTIVSRLGAYSGPFHWKNRRFTLSEYKRLFTFPDDYQLAGSLNVAIQQLGNSVCPTFAELLAKGVIKQVFQNNVSLELLKEETALSFDYRKTKKAHRTRMKRLQNTTNDLPLFEFMSRSNFVAHKEIDHVYYCNYQGWEKIVRYDNDYNLEDVDHLEIEEHYQAGQVDIKVSRVINHQVTQNSLLIYSLNFYHEIGDGIKSINCYLKSNFDQDVVAAWDAVEYYLNNHSNYLSLMDIYGHFTEPHPIFSFNLQLFKKNPSFILKFIKFFSDFSKLEEVYPISLMASFHSAGTYEQRDFLEDVKWLRSLRFDVRVFETNQTIKPGFFRCCYPFTVHVEKQVSVSWKESTQTRLLEK